MPLDPLPRKCVSCGNRLTVRALGKRLVKSTAEVEMVEKELPVRGYMTRYPETRSVSAIVQKEKERLHVRRDVYEIDYHCTKCGHSWKEEIATVREDRLED